MNPFGPILRFELVRIARRQRITMLRCTYIVLLAGIAAATYGVVTDFFTVPIRPHELASVTAGLFYGLFGLQFLLALGTANWAADAIAGEKEKQTLPFLLATPLSDWQIVLGKLTARLAHIFLLALAGVPVLCALEFFGGVEPLAIVLGYAALCVTILSLGSLAVLCSVYARTSRLAAQRTGQVVVGYFFATSVLNSLLLIKSVPPFVLDIVDWFNAGNPLSVIHKLTAAIAGGGRFGDVIIETIRNYALFHVVVTAICLTWAVRRLRSVAAFHADGPAPKKRTGMFRPPPRPPVGDKPVLWKALNFDFRQTKSVAGRTISRVVFVFSFAPVTLALVAAATIGRRFDLPEFINKSIIRGLGTTVLCGVLVIIAAHTSGCVAAERRKKTLDDLLVTDLSTDEILAQKWWASIIVIRWALVWVGIHWLVGILTGGLQPLAVPLLVLEWTTYAAFAASLGMYCAARWPKSREAGVYTGGLGFFLAVGGPIFLALAVGLGTGLAFDHAKWFLFPASISPPVALGVTAFQGSELSDLRQKYAAELIQLVLGVATSVALFGLLAWYYWRGAKHWFPRTLGG